MLDSSAIGRLESLNIGLRMGKACVQILASTNVGVEKARVDPRVLGLSVGMLEAWKPGILGSSSLDLLSDGLGIVECSYAILKQWNSRTAGSRRAGMWESQQAGNATGV